MIKKKRKNRKRKKNPIFSRSKIKYSYQFSKIKTYILRIVGDEDLKALSNLLSFLSIVKDTGDPKTMSWFREYCDDCGDKYYSCKCERCDDCEQNRCICDLDFQTTSKLLNTTVSIAKEILNSKEIRELTKDVRSAMEHTSKLDYRYANYEYFYKLLKS